MNVEERKHEIKRLLLSTNRNGMEEFIKWLEMTDYFTAPASTKYHLNVVGGLSEHSYNVYCTLKKLSNIFGVDIPSDTIIITGLLHDICKIGIYVDPTDSNDKYGYQDVFPIGHGEKSVVLALKHGLKLTDMEMLMIRWHMSMYDPLYPRAQQHVKKYCPEAKLLYFADDISTTYLEE